MTDPLDLVAETEAALRLVAEEANKYLAELDDSPARLPGADQAAARFDGSLPEEGSGAVRRYSSSSRTVCLPPFGHPALGCSIS